MNSLKENDSNINLKEENDSYLTAKENDSNINVK